MFLGIGYRVETLEREGGRIVRLFDGSLPVMSVNFTAEAYAGGPDSDQMTGTACFERRHAAVRTHDEIEPGLELSRHYCPDPVGVAALSERWGADPFVVRILSWCSYLVGMELPGESALFSKIALSFDRTRRCGGKMAYRAAVGSVNPRLGRIRMDVSLDSEAGKIAWGRLWSYVRPDLPDAGEIDATGIRADAMAGRTAVLLGGSRGLGAALKRALELRGATVYSLSRSVTGQASERSEIGDAADPEALRRLRDRVLKEQGRLDLLICNACPPLQPLRMEANAAQRIGAFIGSAVSVTLMPLCWFLDLLNASSGCAVVISSTAVKRPVREWPHYLAAKQAVEMLAQVASLQYPQTSTLVVRPPKLLTALTNTPTGRLGASSPRLFAHRLATRLEAPFEVGKIEVFGD